MTMEFVTGNMDYIRRPFIANIKPGHRVLISQRLLARPARLADRPKRLRGARGGNNSRIVRAPASGLLRPAVGRVRSHDEVGLQCTARLHRYVA